jgi:hypothetical protein
MGEGSQRPAAAADFRAAMAAGCSFLRLVISYSGRDKGKFETGE